MPLFDGVFFGKGVKSMKRYFTPISKLHMSVAFGWGVFVFFTIQWQLESSQPNDWVVYLFYAYIALSIRYSVIRPVELLGAAFAGWMTTTLLEYFSGLRNYGFNPIILGLILGMFIIAFIKGVILSTFFLSRETYQLVLFYKNKSQFTSSTQE
jgi:hypothetical protein